MKANLDLVLPDSDNFSVYEDSEGYLVILPDHNFWFRFTREQLPAFRMPDGSATLGELLKRVDREIPKLLKNTSAALLIDLAEAYPERPKQLSKQNRISNLYLVLTDRCNSNCRYCFRDPSGTGGVLCLADYRKLFSDLRKIASHDLAVIYTGGEPTLYPYLLDLAKASRTILSAENHLQTNGCDLERFDPDRLCDLFDRIQISLDSLNESVNDWLRGRPGHCRSVIRAVEALSRRSVKLRLATTLTRKNMPAIMEIKERFPEVEFQYTPMLPIGRGSDLWDMAFTPDEFADETARLLAESDSFLPRTRPVPGVLQTTCGAGSSVLSVSYNGDLYPCQMLHHSNLLCGNFLQMPVDELYETSPVLERLKRLTVDDIDECRDCDIRYMCSGGCLANGFWQTGRFPCRDAYCKHNLRSFMHCLKSGFRTETVRLD